MRRPPHGEIEHRLEQDAARNFEAESGHRWTVFVEPAATDPDEFALSCAQGLSERPRWLHCRYLYDAIGSELFSQITEQPEYYPTRAEAEILNHCAGELLQRVGPVALCELGSGTSAKTRHLLSAWENAARHGFDYIPVDIDPSVLRESAPTLTHAYPHLRISALATTYEGALDHIEHVSPKLLLFLGSTIGNFTPAELDKFFRKVETALQPGDALLLGVDLVKDASVLEAAYDDAAGVTARFTLNLFARMNRELGCQIPLEAIEHEAIWNPDLEQIEIYGRFHQDAEIALPSVEQSFRIEAGERIWLEVSRKFRVKRLARELTQYGLGLEHTFYDSEQRFGLMLLRKRLPASSATSKPA